MAEQRTPSPAGDAGETTTGGHDLDGALRRLDRLATLGELVAEIAHEIRNPLVSVKTFLQLLPERGSDPEFQQSFLALAAEELRRVERLLDALLEQARPPATATGACPLGESLDAVVQLTRHRAAQRGVKILWARGDGDDAVTLAADALRQVLLNLVLNAIDATPPGAGVQLCTRRAADTVEICVEDEGPGIPAEARERIFEPFYSTRSERAGGLGLAISKRIVEQAGGGLEVGSARSGGARFTLRLPATPA